ncbi:MAG: conserved membrane protein of unknown function [Nitrosopumilales archaeon]|nr:MAG: conserved membrane protein of unknown function [Nitrosopumilales archaeon]
MAKKEPVSVNWQTLFILIPVMDLFAAYRVEKLRLYLLIFYVGITLGSVILQMSLVPEDSFSDEFFDSGDFYPESYWEIGIAILLISYGLAVVLIRKWSRGWNEKLKS